LDPNFLLKKQQHEARHTTWHSGSGALSSGLSNTPAPRKRRPEVSKLSDLDYPKAGFFRQPLNPSDSNYQGTSHSSSGDSTGTQIPAFKTVPGCIQSVKTSYLSNMLISLYFIFQWHGQAQQEGEIEQAG
jgi:hypothetical protein